MADPWEQYKVKDAAPAKDEWAQYRVAEAPQTEPPPPPTARIGAAPKGISAWLNSLEGDVRYGTGSTLPGRILQKLGAQGTDIGSQAGAGEGTLTSPVLGPIHTAQGVAEKKPLKAAAGVLETASLPLQFVGGPALNRTAQAIPSAKYAGQVLGEVEQAAGKIPIKVAQVGDIALETKELAQSGGRMPKVINDFLRRVTDPELPPMTYAEARKFAVNASKLSVAEKNNLAPVMQRQAARFAKALSESIGEAAGEAGQGEKYANAMTEYARAKALSRFGKTAGRLGAEGAIGGGAIYAVERLLGRR